MKTVTILILCIFFVLPSPAGAQQKTPVELQAMIEQLDKTAADIVRDPKAGSLTIGLVQRNGLIWAKSYGYANIEKCIPANPDSVYRIGSITKQFTALMLLQLVHDGVVHFSDPVDKYFPEIHLVPNQYKNASPITLMQLATHTSGLDAEPDDVRAFMKGSVGEWEKVLITALPHSKYLYEPGTTFYYSNIGYASLAVALSRAAHQSYTEYVKEKILLPLGMTHSGFDATPAVRKGLAKGYDQRKDGTFDVETPVKELEGRGYKVPVGGLYSTVGDLARFEVLEMLAGPESVLPKKALKESAERITTTDRDLNRGYGIGLIVQRFSGHVLIGHTGGNAGYRALAYVEPEVATGIIILRNHSRGWADKSKQLLPDLDVDKLLHIFADKLQVDATSAD